MSAEQIGISVSAVINRFNLVFNIYPSNQNLELSLLQLHDTWGGSFAHRYVIMSKLLFQNYLIHEYGKQDCNTEPTDPLVPSLTDLRAVLIFPILSRKSFSADPISPLQKDVFRLCLSLCLGIFCI